MSYSFYMGLDRVYILILDIYVCNIQSIKYSILEARSPLYYSYIDLYNIFNGTILFQ